MSKINNLGEFTSITEVWEAYPYGGKEGDYITINGVTFEWNKYTSNWGEDTKEPKPGINDEVNGDFLVKGDLRVDGEIINKELVWLKNATVLNKGFFSSLNDLIKKHPIAHSGSKAYVGTNFPYKIYIWSAKDSTWIDSGEVYDNANRNKGYFSTLKALEQVYPIAGAGSKAYVGTNYPYAIYLWDKDTSSWVDSGETGGDESVNLEDYYTKEEQLERETNLVNLIYKTISDTAEDIRDDYDNVMSEAAYEALATKEDKFYYTYEEEE